MSINFSDINHNYIDPHIYEKSHVKCPVCESPDIGRLYTIERYILPFRIDTCRKCNFIFMNPRFNDKKLADFYGEDYYSGKSNYSYIDERKMKKYSEYVWDKRLHVIKKFVKSGNFLDIGASFGGFLNSAKNDFTLYGIEISGHAGEYLKKNKEITAHIGTLHDHPFKQNFFSVITMIEVLEHLHDPVFSLRECNKLLLNHGLLVIQTSNMNGWQAKILKDRYAYFMPGHISYFTKKNITDLLKESGFRMIKVFHPVEFGLLPKLLKSRQGFKTVWDYRKWFRIIMYHIMGKINIGSFSLTSSMVVYAVK